MCSVGVLSFMKIIQSHNKSQLLWSAVLLTVVESAGDMLRKTNSAEMQESNVDRISGS